ncbi:MAG: hypothetical protein OXF83_11110 [Anaerolineaceae bacterium]|nr:hypothetical protein [Anaerolineaceae bacterium]MCY3934737.1 hypothetical protein [Chloroflexota bacterium]MCY4009974.1 hypothetical protein [Anaerolineaceae bacterium]MCY4105918.1 hypothetical protein [Chloroflexota bacterium]
MSENENPRETEIESSDSIDSEVVDPLDLIPPEQRSEVVTRLFSSFTSFLSVGPTPNPILSKFNEEHISQFLDQMQRNDDQTHELQKSDRRLIATFILLLGVVFCGGVIYLLPRDRELLILLIQFLVLVAGGIGAGYGIKSRK